MAEAIIKLYQKGFSERKISELLEKPKMTVHDAIECFQLTGSAKSRQGQGGGRPKTARTLANKRKIKGRIQQNKSSRKNPTRKMAKPVGIGRSSVQRILHEESFRAFRVILKFFSQNILFGIA